MDFISIMNSTAKCNYPSDIVKSSLEECFERALNADMGCLIGVIPPDLWNELQRMHDSGIYDFNDKLVNKLKKSFFMECYLIPVFNLFTLKTRCDYTKIKEIKIDAFDGRFGPKHVHWNEKMSIKNNGIIYKKEYFTEFENKDCVCDECNLCVDKWSYSSNTKEFTNSLNNLLAEFRNLIENGQICRGCDMDGIEMYFAFNDGYSFRYHNSGDLSYIANDAFINAFLGIVPRKEKLPNFIGTNY